MTVLLGALIWFLILVGEGGVRLWLSVDDLEFGKNPWADFEITLTCVCS